MHVEKFEINEWNLVVHYLGGKQKEIDIRDLLSGASSTEAKKIITDIKYFHKIKLEDGAAFVWPSGFSVDPDWIYEFQQTLKSPFKSASRVLLAALRSLLK